MMKEFVENANGDVILRQRGRRLTLNFLIGFGNEDYLIRIKKGEVVGV